MDTDADLRLRSARQTMHTAAGVLLAARASFIEASARFATAVAAYGDAQTAIVADNRNLDAAHEAATSGLALDSERRLRQDGT